MDTILTVNDAYIARLISKAQYKLAYVAPGIGMEAVNALAKKMRDERVSKTIIIDPQTDPCMIGYGDHEALSKLCEIATEFHIPLRQQIGLRVGMLVSDEDLVIWSPIAKSVEAEKNNDQPNAIFLSGSVVEKIESAMGCDNSDVLASNAEVGQEPLKIEVLKKTVEELKKNPPAPFDLSQRARVFSTKFQFVEFTVRGAEWTDKTIKISSFLFNADLPEDLRNILDTSVKPYKSASDIKLPIPLLVEGEPVFRRDGTEVMEMVTQADIKKMWNNIQDNYLNKLKGFGWLIRKERYLDFLRDVEKFECALKTWVKGFKEYVKKDEDALFESIVNSIEDRFRNSQIDRNKFDLRGEIQAGFERMKIIEPEVRIVTKNVSWESSRDSEFKRELKNAFGEKELLGWFEEFTAVKEKS